MNDNQSIINTSRRDLFDLTLQVLDGLVSVVEIDEELNRTSHEDHATMQKLYEDHATHLCIIYRGKIEEYAENILSGQEHELIANQKKLEDILRLAHHVNFILGYELFVTEHLWQKYAVYLEEQKTYKNPYVLSTV